MRVSIAIIFVGLLATYAHPHEDHEDGKLAKNSMDRQTDLKFEDRNAEPMERSITKGN